MGTDESLRQEAFLPSLGKEYRVRRIKAASKTKALLRFKGKVRLRQPAFRNDGDSCSLGMRLFLLSGIRIGTFSVVAIQYSDDDQAATYRKLQSVHMPALN